MFRIANYTEQPNNVQLIMEYSIPFYNTPVKRAIELPTKKAVMLMFASSINTLLDIRLDEFNEIIRYRIKPHFFDSKAYPYFRNNTEWCEHYWKFIAFLENIREKQNHRHQVAKEIKESIHLFKNVRSNKVALQHFDQVLNQMIPEIESLCKKIMELSEKLHNEFRNEL